MAKELDGKVFVVTGTLPSFTRNGVQEFIEAYGGKVTDSVTKKISFLVLLKRTSTNLALF